MDVAEAIASRKSVRAFLDTPVDPAVVRDIVARARRAPSGGNLQPWRLYVMAGAVRDRLVTAVQAKYDKSPFGEGAEYDIYPTHLTDPYRTRRRVVGQQLYDLLGIAKEDKIAKLQQVRRNFEFFGAPVGMIATLDRQMNQPQWADVGMFLQNIMLLARAHGLDTCPQESWALFPKTIAEVLDVPENEMVFCGMSLGYADPAAPENTLASERAEVDEVVVFQGF